MIYEVRTYDLKPGTVPEFEKAFSEALAERLQHSPLAAFFRVEVGPLNQVVHIWPYDSLEARSRIRAESVQTGSWPPRVGKFIERMNSEIMIPYGFIDQLPAGKVGPFFEFRQYILPPGEVNKIPEQWEPALPARAALSPLVAVWHSEIGALNKFGHIWAYESLDQRMSVRAEAAAKKLWPPPGSCPRVQMENKIMVPAAFSPIQ